MAKLPKFEDWTPPWKDGEFDAEKAAKFIYNLERDKETLTTEKAQISTERDELRTKVDEFESKDLSEVQKLQRKIEQLEAAKPTEDPKAALKTARLELAVKHSLSLEEANRLQGETPEELEADVEVLKGLLGGKKGKEQEREAPGGRFRTGNEDPSDNTDDTLASNPAQAAKLFH